MKWNEFERIIDRYFEKFEKGIEQYYVNWKNNLVWKKYYGGNIDKTDINNVIKFLNEWGRMYRVNGKLKKQMGEEEFLNANISAGKNCQNYFLLLKKYEFTTINFGEIITFDREIMRLRDINELIFSKLGEVLKWTSPSKIMHMVNPNLFLMWDDNIRISWGCGHKAKAYTNFIIRMQLEYGELIEDFLNVKNISGNDPQDVLLKNLNDKINKKIPLTRWIDMYNWMKYTNLKNE